MTFDHMSCNYCCRKICLSLEIKKGVIIRPGIMKTMCQLYLFMYLFRFAASCRFFSAWQQTHWLNYYFCLSDASCMLKNQRCSNEKRKNNNCLSFSFHTDSSWWAAAVVFQVLLHLKHHERLHHVPRSQQHPRSSWPTFSINTPEQRWRVWGCASFILLTYTQHFYLLWVYLFMSTFIYPRKSGEFRPSLELLNLLFIIAGLYF